MTQRVVNYTYGTGNPVQPNGSIDVRDGIDNLQSFDVFMNADEDTYNQRDGEIVKTLAGAVKSVGIDRVGDFTSGCTVTDRNQGVLYETDGTVFVWLGALHKVGPPASSPETTGGIGPSGWLDIGDASLRGDLAESDGSALIGDVQQDGYVYPNKIPRFADTAGVATLLIPDDPAQRLFINKVCTNPDDFTAVQIARHANYTGGTAGAVGTAVQAKTYVEPTATSTSEWAALFQLDNNAPNNPGGGGPGAGALPQNVAIYGQAQKRSTGATWALCTEINDHLTAGADGATLNHELACSSNGPDNATTPQRNASHVAIGKLLPAGLDLEWGRGYWVSTGAGARVRYAFDNTANVGDSVFHNKGSAALSNSALLRDEGSLVEGINTTLATYSSSRALTMKVGQKIAFDEASSFTLFGSAAAGGIVCTGKMQLNGSFTTTSANTSLTATAGGRTLPATPGGFLNIAIDGVPMRIPYYGA